MHVVSQQYSEQIGIISTDGFKPLNITLVEFNLQFRVISLLKYHLQVERHLLLASLERDRLFKLR